MDKSMDIACAEYSVTEYIKKVTWALPVRSNLRSGNDVVWVIHNRSEKQEEGNS